MDQTDGKSVNDDTSQDFTVRHGIDLNECLEDSPDLREHLENHEKEISELETSLERMVQLCSSMVSAGHKYNQSWREFGMHLKEMGAHFSTNEKVMEIFKTTSDLFSGLSTYYSVLFDQVQRSVQNAVKNFLVCEIGKLRESKRQFDRTAEEFNSALHKNASSPKSKPAEAEEASKALQASTVAFSVVAMDHAYQINCLQAKKGYEVLEKVVSMARALFKFFTDGNDTMKKFEPTIEQMGTEIDVMKKEAVIEGKRMERRGSLVKKVRVSTDSNGAISSPPLSASSSEGELQESVALRGFLFKRNSSKFKMWNRRYFIMKDNQLQYLKKGPTKEMHIIAEDLRLCAVKNMEDTERRFCFEIVAPSKSFLLQADSDAIRKKWMAAIQASIASAFRQSMSASTAVEDGEIAKGSPLSSTTTDPSRVTRRLMRVVGNDKCADCGSTNPTWASINIGVLLCIECSGIHRSLGVHISKVRSVTLDAWEPEVLRLMTKLGNTIANSILEYAVPTGMVKPVANSPRSEKEQWIKAKYVQHKFVHPHISVPDISTIPSDIPATPELPHQQMTQSLASINRPSNSTEDFLADDSAPESEYDSKSLKRKKKQNKIRRWAMDKIVKRAANSVREGIGIIGRESPAVPGDDEVSIGENQNEMAVRTLSLKERKPTFSSGEMPPPKPPRSRKAKSAVLEKSVMEPLLAGEDPMSGDWYKGGSLFEKEDFCDSILEVIKNIGYTCESPGSSMLQSDTEAPAAVNGEDNSDRKKNEEVIANSNFLEESTEVTSLAKRRSGDDFTDSPSGEPIYEEIPDEFQQYSAEDDASNMGISMYEEVVTSLNARAMKEKSVSASDVSLEFFSAHSSPTNSFDNHTSPMIPEDSEPVYALVNKPAKKLENTAWNSEESTSGVVSCTSILQESPSPSKSPAGVSELIVADATPSTDVVSSKENSPEEISQEKNSPNVEVTNLEPELVAAGNDSDSAQDTTEPKSSALLTASGTDSTVTLKRMDLIEPSSKAISGQINEACSTPASEHDTGPPCMVIESNSNTPSVEQDDVPEDKTTVVIEDASSDVVTSELPMHNGLVKMGDGSPVMTKLLLPVVDNADLFASEDELDDTRALNTPEPIIIPLTKTAHEYLYSSAKSGNIPGMLCALAHGANVNFMNPEEELKCPLIASVLAESLESTEFLLQNGAKLHLRDSRGRGCLHHAAYIGAIGHVCLLLKRGTVAHLHSLDEMGKDALDIAVEKCNADIVTLLRLAKLNDDSETVDERQNKTLQDTVNLVYKDIRVNANDSLIDSPSSGHPPFELTTSTAQQ